jgi:subtilisin family serine protease
MTSRFFALKFALCTLSCLLFQQISLSSCFAQDPPRQLKTPTRIDTPSRNLQPQTVPNVLLIMPSEQERNPKSKTNAVSNSKVSVSQAATADKRDTTVVSTKSGVTNYGAGTKSTAYGNTARTSAISGNSSTVNSSLASSTSAGNSSNATDEPEDENQGEDLVSSIRSMGGTVVDTIGEGPMTVWVVKFQNTERFIKAEKQLVNDTRVKNLQRDYLFKTNVLDDSALADLTPNDPYYASEWYFNALNVLPAWKLSKGRRNVIGVIDSGTNNQIEDLKQKCADGYDAIDQKEGQSDVHGHGTMVATTAAATANNGEGTAGPATLSEIYPVRVGYSTGVVSVSAIVRGIERCGNNGVKIINISSNGDPPYTFASRKFNRVLHQYLQWYHDEKGGLVFNSAGNAAMRDQSGFFRYLIVVSAIDENYSLAYFSNTGSPLWFTAPGTNIVCSDNTGRVVTVSGTSFSSPLCASIAALVWGANPKLTNLQVEKILIDTCIKDGRRKWTRFFGYGLPDAEAAMRKALGQ